MMGWIVLLVMISGAAAGAPNDPSVWRFPYASPFITTNPSDGLPDFALNFQNGTIGPNNISCPAELQRSCCTLCQKGNPASSAGLTGENCDACCKASDQNRACRGGTYCRSGDLYLTAQNLMATLAPNYLGTSMKENRTAIPRTRKNILERAVGWLATHTPYWGCHTGGAFLEACGSTDTAKCPQYAYTGSCCGYVSMAVGVTEVQGHPENRVQIECKDMRPGDFVAHVSQGGGISHWWMFRDWAKAGVPGEMRLYQMGGGAGSANMQTQTKKDQYNKPCEKKGDVECINCFKYPHLTDDVSAAAPLAVPFFDDGNVNAGDNMMPEHTRN